MSNILKGRFEEKKFQDNLKKLQDFKQDQPGRAYVLRLSKEDIVKNRRRSIKLIKGDK